MGLETKGGLTVEQQKAAWLYAQGRNLTDRQISNRCGVSVHKLRKWKQTARFKLRVLQLLDAEMDVDRANRIKHVKGFLNPVYEELAKRLDSKDGLKNVSLRELVRMMSILHAELRADNSFIRRLHSEIGKIEDVDVNDDSEFYEEDDISMNDISEIYESSRAVAEKSTDKKVVPIPKRKSR